MTNLDLYPATTLPNVAFSSTTEDMRGIVNDLHGNYLGFISFDGLSTVFVWCRGVLICKALVYNEIRLVCGFGVCRLGIGLMWG